MPTRISREDIIDADIVDAQELASRGLVPYKTGSVVHITGSFLTASFSAVDIGFLDFDEPTGPPDALVVSGSGNADGYYVVSGSVSENILRIQGAFSGSGTSSGSWSLYYQPGGVSVGFNPVGINSAITSGSNLQQAVHDIAVSLGTGVVTGVPPNFLSTSSFNISSTTSIPFQEKVSIRSNLTTTGSYYIIWYCELTDTSNGQIGEVHTLVSGTSGVYEAGIYNFKFATGGAFVPFGGFSLSTQSLGPLTASIEFRVPAGGSTVQCRRASLGIWRVT
jgi:hypothetical protein